MTENEYMKKTIPKIIDNGDAEKALLNWALKVKYGKLWKFKKQEENKDTSKEKKRIMLQEKTKKFIEELMKVNGEEGYDFRDWVLGDIKKAIANKDVYLEELINLDWLKIILKSSRNYLDALITEAERLEESEEDGDVDEADKLFDLADNVEEFIEKWEGEEE